MRFRVPFVDAPGAAFCSVLFIATALTPRAGSAQELMDQKSVIEVRKRYLADLDTVHVKIMSLAEAIPESSYTWRPVAGVRSISEALMHVASEWYFFTPLLIGGNAPANFGAPREALPKLEKITAKKEVLSELAKAWTYCKQQIEASDVTKLMSPYTVFGRDVPFAEAAFIMSGDLHEHLGQLIAYARSVNVTPPWSKK
jgi:uncharacterized damage-inducible protein DinB